MPRHQSLRIAARLSLFLLCLGWLAASVQAAPAPDLAAEGETRSLFVDAQDDWLDVSGFLDTAYGFLPILIPITEPAVGYGAGAGLLFIDRHQNEAGNEVMRPNIATVGGLRTENGTKGWFAGHLGTWMEGDLRTIAAVADTDINLEFFGIGDGRVPGEGLPYTLSARGGVAGASWRIGATQLWLGARYAAVDTDVALDEPALPGVSEADYGVRLGGLTPSITLDLRDNFFTPTRGWYVDLSAPLFSESLGSDRDFEKLELTVMHWRPLGTTTYFGVRGAWKGSSDDTPFFLRPYVSLRGVQALEYQGEQAAELEAEMRWQFHPRFSAVGFAGAGIASGDASNDDQDVVAGGVGFRYLIARRHGLHMGMDLAAGPDELAIYIIVGSAWSRP